MCGQGICAQLDQGGGAQHRQQQIGRRGGQAHAHDQGYQHGHHQRDHQVALRHGDDQTGELDAQVGQGGDAHDDTGAGAGCHNGAHLLRHVAHHRTKVLQVEGGVLLHIAQSDGQDGGIGAGTQYAVTADDEHDQQRDRQQIVETGLEHHPHALILGIGIGAQVQPLGLKVHGDTHGKEVQQRGHGCGLSHGEVAYADHLGHQERHGTHDRRQDLSAVGGHCLHRTGEVLVIAVGLHQRNGEGAGGHDVGYAAAGDGAHQGAGGHGGQRGTAGNAPGGGQCQVHEELAGAAFLQKRAKENEYKDKCRTDTHCRTENTLGTQIQERDQALECKGLVAQRTGDEMAKQAIEQEDHGDGGQRPAQGLISHDQDRHQQQRAEDHIQLSGDTQAPLDLRIVQADVEVGAGGSHQPDKIDDDVKNFPLLLGVCHVEQEDVAARQTKVYRPLVYGGQNAEQCSVRLKQGQQNGNHKRDLAQYIAEF